MAKKKTAKLVHGSAVRTGNKNHIPFVRNNNPGTGKPTNGMKRPK